MRLCPCGQMYVKTCSESPSGLSALTGLLVSLQLNPERLFSNCAAGGRVLAVEDGN